MSTPSNYDYLSSRQVARILNLGRNTFLSLMREAGVLNKENLPSPNAKTQNPTLFKVRTEVKNGAVLCKTTYYHHDAIALIAKLLKISREYVPVPEITDYSHIHEANMKWTPPQSRTINHE
jgi:hypothetical protein